MDTTRQIDRRAEDLAAAHDPGAELRVGQAPLIDRQAEGNGKSTLLEALSSAPSSGGASLPGPLREQFESSVGADLDGIRLHTGAESAEACDAVGAQAFAVGHDIHFGAGHYNPSSSQGQELIAHEVAHSVQQGDLGSAPQFKLDLSSPQDAHEVEADRAADAMLRGEGFSLSSFEPSISRKQLSPLELAALEGETIYATGIAKDMAHDRAYLQQRAKEDKEGKHPYTGMYDPTKLQTSPVLLASTVSDQQGIRDAMAKLAGIEPDLIVAAQQGEDGAQNALQWNQGCELKLGDYLATTQTHDLAMTQYKPMFVQLERDFGRLEGMAALWGCKTLTERSRSIDPDDSRTRIGNELADEQNQVNGTDASSEIDELMKAHKDMESALAEIGVLEKTEQTAAQKAAAANTKFLSEVNHILVPANHLKALASTNNAELIRAGIAKGIPAAQSIQKIAGGIQGAAASTASTLLKEGAKASKALSGASPNITATGKGKDGKPIYDPDMYKVGTFSSKIAEAALGGGVSIVQTLFTEVVWPQLQKMLADLAAAGGQFPDCSENVAQAEDAKAKLAEYRAAKGAMKAAIDNARLAGDGYRNELAALDNAKLATKARLKTIGAQLDAARKAKRKKDGKPDDHKDDMFSNLTTFLGEADGFLAQGTLCKETLSQNLVAWTRARDGARGTDRISQEDSEARGQAEAMTYYTVTTYRFKETFSGKERTTHKIDDRSLRFDLHRRGIGIGSAVDTGNPRYDKYEDDFRDRTKRDGADSVMEDELARVESMMSAVEDYRDSMKKTLRM